ncbi:MAG: MoxR family ATPase [Planctomycetota bacterium]
MTATTSTQDAAAPGQALSAAVRRVVAVPPEVLEPLLCALVAGGHALIEGVPGTGKTLLAKTLARCVDCSFHRIQFTNDLMPSDIVGSMVWRPKAEQFAFVRGPLFANLVLADEINRTSPRTLSCLLEAMENGAVTVEGRTLSLGTPFLVLATRNPIEFHGTYPVPEAALDRFLVRVELDYPDPESELRLYSGTQPEQTLGAMEPLLSRDQLLAAQVAVDEVVVREPVIHYCHRVVMATRADDRILLGASPRAALAWLRTARARASLVGRTHVLPDDLKALALPVLAHRIFLKGSGDAANIVADLVEHTPVEL